MTELRRDAAYIRTDKSSGHAHPAQLSDFDETVCEVLGSAHTVTSATKTLAKASPPATGRTADDGEANLESRVTESMTRLLQAERIELSPDS